jgi:cytochrome c6
MGRVFTFCIVIMAFCSFVTFGIAGKAVSAISGEAGFKQHCAICHPDGGNIINPQKTEDVFTVEASTCTDTHERE